MDSGEDSPSQAAARWYARLRAPDCGVEERSQFEAWLRSDARHAAAYAAAERLSNQLAQLATTDARLRGMVDQAASAGAGLPDDPAEEHVAGKPSPLEATAGSSRAAPSRRRVARRLMWAAGVAAAAVTLLVLSTLGGSEPEANADPYRYATARAALRYESDAARRGVTLDDGTRVYLDLASAIEVRFSATRRDVTLLRGRALFDVAHDAARPFVVFAGNDRVTALGTIFQVDRAATEVVVTLTRGTVTVSSRNGSTAVQLSPGEQLRSSAGDTHWEKRSIDTRSATSWSLGKHIFHDTPLGEAIREINRYADKKVRLSDPRLAALAVSGEFATGDSESIARALIAALPVRVIPVRAELMLYPAPRAADAAPF